MIMTVSSVHDSFTTNKFWGTFMADSKFNVIKLKNSDIWLFFLWQSIYAGTIDWEWVLLTTKYDHKKKKYCHETKMTVTKHRWLSQKKSCSRKQMKGKNQSKKQNRSCHRAYVGRCCGNLDLWFWHVCNIFLITKHLKIKTNPVSKTKKNVKTMSCHRQR